MTTPLHGPPNWKPAGPVMEPDTLPCPAPASAGASATHPRTTPITRTTLRAPDMLSPPELRRSDTTCCSGIAALATGRVGVEPQRACARSAIRCCIESLGARLGATVAAACDVAAAAE